MLREAAAIQYRLKSSTRTISVEERSQKFANFVINGNINGALRLQIMRKYAEGCGVLPITDYTLSMLREKHPEGIGMPDEMVLFGPRENVEPVIYETIDAEMIAKLAFSMKGTSGPSKFDANDWKRILATKIYASEGHDLPDAIARMARLLCTEDVTDPDISSNGVQANPTR